MTIATDNQRLYNGITQDVATWEAKGFLDEQMASSKIAHGNLWCRLLNLVNEQAYHGCEVNFWCTTAEQNQEAASMAHAIAPLGTVPGLYHACGHVSYTFKVALEADMDE